MSLVPPKAARAVIGCAAASLVLLFLASLPALAREHAVPDGPKAVLASGLSDGDEWSSQG